MDRTKQINRTKQMIRMFTVKYLTYQEIGEHFEISRERVRQLLSAAGITKEQGGHAQQVIKNRKSREATDLIKAKKLAARSEKRVQKNYGCSVAEYTEINQGKTFYKSPINLYRNKRRNAINQGIGWELTLTEWWEIWKNSGKWDERGKSVHQYVMTRKDLRGSFSINNIVICTLQESTIRVRAYEKMGRTS